MELPADFPDDVNYEWYITEAKTVLGSLGCVQQVLFPAA